MILLFKSTLNLLIAVVLRMTQRYKPVFGYVIVGGKKVNDLLLQDQSTFLQKHIALRQSERNYAIVPYVVSMLFLLNFYYANHFTLNNAS